MDKHEKFCAWWFGRLPNPTWNDFLKMKKIEQLLRDGKTIGQIKELWKQ